jgi:hypothetical protein
VNRIYEVLFAVSIRRSGCIAYIVCSPYLYLRVLAFDFAALKDSSWEVSDEEIVTHKSPTRIPVVLSTRDLRRSLGEN